ncbi:hypothetical protein As57867_014606, partial [Aphanomyces stellatus]
MPSLPSSPRRPQPPSKANDLGTAQPTAPLQRPATTPQVSEWVRSVRRERHAFVDFAEYCKVQLEHAVRSSEHQGDPNAFRTAVCFELLAMVGQQFGRYDALFRVILTECERSVYVSPETKLGTRVSDWFALQPYFAELQVQRAAKDTMDTEIAHLDGQHHFMMQQLATKENVIDRTTDRWARTVLLQVFRTWQTVTIEAHKVKLATAKTMAR